MQELSIPGNPLFDMGAVDILRARERGVPRYNEFRRQLGLNPIRTLRRPHRRRRAACAELKRGLRRRAEDVEHLDLLVGTLAERRTGPPASVSARRMFQIFILNASRRLQADRFYTDDYNEEVYTQEGLRLDRRRRPSRRCSCATTRSSRAPASANVKNAFEPWDAEPRSTRSAIRFAAFDPELKKNPWLGDSYR